MAKDLIVELREALPRGVRIVLGDGIITLITMHASGPRAVQVERTPDLSVTIGLCARALADHLATYGPMVVEPVGEA